MTTTKKEAKEFEEMLDKLREPMTKEEEYRNADVPMPRGPNDLEEIIERLEFRNDALHKHNTKQMEEIMDLRSKIAKLEKRCYKSIQKQRRTIMEKGEKINIKVFNWGPCVIKCQIKPEYAKTLLDESKANNIDFRDKLAGQIEDETSYSDEARNRMVPF